MKALFSIIIFSISPLIASSQATVKDTVKLSLDNSINGAYTKYKDDSDIVNIGFIGDNTINYKKLKINTASNYSLSFRDTITANEFVEKTNVGYGDVFVSSVYTQSFIRSIKNDNSFGVGYGRKLSFRKMELSLSYAILYQKTLYKDGSSKELERSSFRVKSRYDGDLLGFSAELYYQPDLKYAKDYIVYGNAKIVFLPKRKLSFVLQDAVNYISKSQVRMLHNLTFGVGYTFKNYK